MRRRNHITPKLIAQSLTSDPDVFNESLYGYHVKNGPSQVDQFILAVERNYIDWDLENSKFQTLFYKVFKAPTSVSLSTMGSTLINALNSSAQNPALIAVLTDLTNKQMGGEKAGSANISKSTVILYNGARFDCAVVIDGASRRGLHDDILWLGLANTKMADIYRESYGRHIHILPELYKFKGKTRHPRTGKSVMIFHRPYKIVTVLKSNVSKIES